MDNEKASVGRVIFYDKNLSKDGEISCASCHIQNKAFADGWDFSPGVDGHVISRNSMALTNVASFASHYTEIEGRTPALLWDGRADDIFGQAPLAFTNPHEMGLTLTELHKSQKSNHIILISWNAFMAIAMFHKKGFWNVCRNL
ncbi:MAG: cytochrome-c peroxidase [Saprospiraceae bacterium]